jgi:hypothetical protein
MINGVCSKISSISGSSSIRSSNIIIHCSAFSSCWVAAVAVATAAAAAAGAAAVAAEKQVQQ